MSNEKLVLNTKEFSLLYHHFLQRTNGRNTMSARELCEIDDLCTTLVVDPLVRFKSHKMDLNYKPPDMQTHLLCLSIMLQFVYDGDIMKVYRGLYSLKYTQDFLRSRDAKARDHVRDHLLRFIAMFRHDAGYTIVPCDRYGHENHVGGMLISTKYWKKNEQMTLLIGVIGNMTIEEEQELLIVGENDFSVLMSQRTQRPQLWLGPGAFLNHDCNPNCEFVSNRSNTAVVTVIRDINPGDELFIYYGSGFFGEGNVLCECSTCESRQMGAFVPKVNENGETEAPTRKRAASPTPSMFSTFTTDAEGNVRYKRALRARKQVTVEEMIFDSVRFFQDIVLDRFIGKPLIIGTDSVSNKQDYPVLEQLRFEPQGIPKLEECRAADLMCVAADDSWNDYETNVDPTPMELHFPEPPEDVEELTPSNLLAFLGLNVCVMEQIVTRGGKIMDKKLAISSSRPWSSSHRPKPWRDPLRVKRRVGEGVIMPQFISEKDFSRLQFEAKTGRLLELSTILGNYKQRKLNARQEAYDMRSRSVTPTGSGYTDSDRSDSPDSPPPKRRISRPSSSQSSRGSRSSRRSRTSQGSVSPVEPRSPRGRGSRSPREHRSPQASHSARGSHSPRAPRSPRATHSH